MDETIDGIIARVYFASPAFSAGTLESEDGRGIKFSGRFHAIEGDSVSLTGSWERHRKYGRQFAVKSVAYNLPQTAEGLMRYLAGNPAFRGIGTAGAGKLVGLAKTAAELEFLLNGDLEKLKTRLRIPMPALQNLRDAWSRSAKSNTLRTYLAGFELTEYQVNSLLDKFGDGVVGAFRADPYILLGCVKHFSFKRIDVIARKTGIAKNHPGRLRAGVMHVVREELANGHTWISAGELVAKANELLIMDSLDSVERIRAAGKDLLEAGDLVAHAAHVSLPQIREDEALIRDTFARFAWQQRTVASVPDEFLAGLLCGQKQAVRLTLGHRISVITGAAGTGKSLTIARIAGACTGRNLRVAVCAPTGKAAKRAEELLLAAGLRVEAKTIHRMLGFDGHAFHAGRVDADVVIIDEVSMVSADLMAEVLRHIDFKGTSLILVGDHNQLPSVGAGSVLRDIITHGLAPVAHLTQVVRQAGVLKANCNRILSGQIVPTDQDSRDWIVIDRFKEPAAIQSCLRDLIRHHIPRQLHFDPLREVQIITPTHRGPLGTREVNKMLQYLHHGPVDRNFTPGDRVVQKVNDYGNEIFNGSLGTVRAIETEGIHIEFDLEGTRLLEWERARALKLAYCLTIHSMQGSEAPCVILLLHKSHWHAGRQLVYTGATRARKTLIILGDRWGIRRAIKQTQASQRRTMLQVWGKPAGHRT